MPKLTWTQLQEHGRQGVIPPRHPKGCPQNRLRMLAVQRLQAGREPEEVRAWVERALETIDHWGHS